MQFKVPQNIDMEDKIVGPLTLVQFMELMVTCLVFYATFRSGSLVLTLAVGAPVLLAGLALAFVKIQDQSFSHFALALVQYMLRPRYRVWKKDIALERMTIPAPVTPIHRAEEAEFAAQTQHRKETMGQLEKLTRMLDTQGEAAVEASGGITAKGIEKTVEASQPRVIPVKSNTGSRVKNQELRMKSHE